MATIETIRTRLERSRKELLDLSARNRLINTLRGRSKSRSLEIVDELADEVFRVLVRDKKAMSFLPGSESTTEESQDSNNGTSLDQPTEEQAESGVAGRHSDTRLQTAIASESLQKRLLNIYYDARTFEEEQGVNILYLAMGFLKWYEAPTSDRERYAPLILIPVEIERQNAGSRFKLKFREEDITTNLSLQAKLLDQEFGVRLPDVAELDDLIPSVYFETVRTAIQNQPRWEVLPNDMVLWFFSFAKFLMYRDLDPTNWPGGSALQSHFVLKGLLEEGFGDASPICGDEDKIDPLISVADLVHVMDADSSQAVAIEEVRRGRNLVIQGPPGTGKSQTIANLIAMAVKENKTVLFVAEKMAALEVVKRRLDKVGLGEMCLELHSHKANKRAVLDDLANTLYLSRPKRQGDGKLIEELTFLRDKLNGHVEIMHAPLPQAQITPYEVIGNLIRLRARGVPPPDFDLVNPTTWTRQEVLTNVNLLHDVSLHMQGIGVPAEHPWRGVMVKAILPTDVERLQPTIVALIGQLDRLIVASKALGKELHVQIGESAGDTSMLARLGQKLLAAPEMDRASIANDVWRSKRNEIDQLVAKGQELFATQQKLDGLVTDLAWSTELAQTRKHLAAHGRSWLRWFKRDYREAQGTLRGILKDDPPKSLAERLSIVDALLDGQRSLWQVSVMSENVELGRRAFGTKWKNDESDWAQLEAISLWERECQKAQLPSAFRAILARMVEPSKVKSLIKQIGKDLSLQGMEVVFQKLNLNLELAFGNAKLSAIPVDSLKARLQIWLESSESLTSWIAFRNRWDNLESRGMGSLGQKLYDGSFSPQDAEDRFHVAYFEQLMRELIGSCPALAEFDGQSHERIVELFRNRDVQRLEMARHEVALAHHAKIPSTGMGIGEVGIVQREINRKRGHLPVRKLLREAGNAVQSIKPVFMMSPISVAQYLEPGHLGFDLLLIDEASQVNPVDALGAIARAKQIVVVGDDKQLPPTRFFDKATSDDGDDGNADGSVSIADIESILGLCTAQGMSQRMLRWHYRSHHHSLIAVSNREFYNDRLYVVPSAFQSSEDQGLVFRHVKEGVFDRGGSATNRIEARVVAQAVMRHARENPRQSLGIGAFSVAQRDIILDEVEGLRRQDSSCEGFFSPGKSDPFFVKNLENIQGDERDVIFISVGYGRDKDGNLAMNFGPLQTDGGERRLNVLISRARDRCEVFSSITAEDIDLARARSRGASAFKTFLQFAKTGILDIGVATGGDFGSDFEAEVARGLTSYGYEVHSQVGMAGFFIDLAVVDPEVPGRYLLGVECDGATYHSSRSARDRDRLRENILVSRGWIIHRIWSTDWFHRPEDQIRKTLAAIDLAKIEWASRTAKGPADNVPPPEATEVIIKDRVDFPLVVPEDKQFSIPYEEIQLHSIPCSAFAMPSIDLCARNLLCPFRIGMMDRGF